MRGRYGAGGAEEREGDKKQAHGLPPGKNYYGVIRERGSGECKPPPKVTLSASDVYVSERRPRLGPAFFLSVVKAVVRGSIPETKIRKK